ncbi:nucleotidyltransferase domain-containing protein [Rhizobium sp. C4]|uniref:nucleotidyltransferase domain-containing protein n=1 Tax=Rhizobium sp. C4 TaxID=1349800 RepID=UPI001E5303F4|nr:nucleotidyltransferase [Rhizobium sp. C4]MCD2176090.1 nucleotidyltransferase [Rhizobium sp. C4]
MAVSEAQLETWSAQGSIQQSAATYKTISDVLKDARSPYHLKNFDTFLQGSYGNDTNVWADSDVDIVIRLTSVYYSDTSNLSAIEKANFDKGWSKAEYSLGAFKSEVTDWLTRNFGSSVTSGSKAIFVPGNSSRRDVDVLPCAEHRTYISYQAYGEPNYREGIVFWTNDGTEVINYPKQHSANCTAKHQNTKGYFKPTVRIFKNIRNRMVTEGRLGEGIAPSYFLEGMLWNVPNNLFGSSYQQTVIDCFNYIYGMQDKSSLTCANGIHWLLRHGHKVCWSPNDHETFMETFKKYWNEF